MPEIVPDHARGPSIGNSRFGRSVGTFRATPGASDRAGGVPGAGGGAPGGGGDGSGLAGDGVDSGGGGRNGGGGGPGYMGDADFRAGDLNHRPVPTDDHSKRLVAGGRSVVAKDQ